MYIEREIYREREISHYHYYESCGDNASNTNNGTTTNMNVHNQATTNIMIMILSCLL